MLCHEICTLRRVRPHGASLSRIRRIMRLVRLVLAWLLVASVPLQGYAAACMLFCGPAASHGHMSVVSEASSVHAPGTHDGHIHVSGASVHSHDDVGASSVQPDHHSSGKLPELTHKCGACAACSHCVAISQSPRPAAAALPPHSNWQEPVVSITSVPGHLPDKPPRA